MTQPARPDAGAPGHAPDGEPPARRRWLFGAVAGIAALAGWTLAWRSGQFARGSGTDRLALWDLAFSAPDGTLLPMQGFLGKPLLLNFWATWCPPCVEELPLLDRFYVENKSNGWQVLGLAVDQRQPVVRFLERAPVRFPIALAGMAGADLGRTLGNQQGGLPFTVVFDRTGQVVHRKMGTVTPQDLQQWRALR